MLPEHSFKQIGSAGISAGLRDLGARSGDVLLVHSSLKSFGVVDGGAAAVISALLATVGPGGTIMVPTNTGTREDSPEHQLLFDVRQTPCWTGLIPETFRRRSDARRSLHPTHSVASIGPHTQHLIKDHLDCDTPCGEGSPYLRLAELDGQMVFLGVTLECCTLLHSAEELAGCAYHLQSQPAPAVIVDEQGRRLRRSVRLHEWATSRRFPVMEPIFLKAGIMRIGRIGQAQVRVLRAGPALEKTLSLLRKSPRFLCSQP